MWLIVNTYDVLGAARHGSLLADCAYLWERFVMKSSSGNLRAPMVARNDQLSTVVAAQLPPAAGTIALDAIWHSVDDWQEEVSEGHL
jgi:hypothetical protein